MTYLVPVNPSSADYFETRLTDPETARNRLMQNDALALIWNNLWRDTLTPQLQSVYTINTSKAYLTMTELHVDSNADYPYQQAEFCIPLAIAGTCLRGFKNTIIQDSRLFWRSPILFRFCNHESPLLSPTHG